MLDAASAGLSPKELYLFNQGSYFYSYRTFGAHILEMQGFHGVRFVVWAPNAESVRIVGDFNDWNGSGHVMERIGTTGVWWLFVQGIGEGTLYKYEIRTPQGTKVLKSDPYAFFAQRRPDTASVVYPHDRYFWRDEDWMRSGRKSRIYSKPLLIYEVHLGSWKIKGNDQFMTYEELAEELVDYAVRMGYTHVELLPVTEHPFDRSWGYQTTGYYAATSRYGEPDQLKRFVDKCHLKGIGVILDWVPGHFCKDDHGLRMFDGTPIYEGMNAKRAEKPLWGTLAFDFGRAEVQSFLLSNAIYWMDVYHMDGLRVDAVASMIDLHFDKPPEQFTWNTYGGKENLDAIKFLKKLNETVFHYFPETLMIAEDSSSWPGVTSPTYAGGLGFNLKWNMGWMNDMLRYMALDPADRVHHHRLITFSLMYAFSENYVLPLSHDEVVHGKRSLLNKMPGDYAEKFAQLRLFYGYWMTHPGKKLLFMGGEWGQFDEWKDQEELDWMLLDYDMHHSIHRYTRQLNHFYTNEPALWERDFDSEGFEWIDVHNAEQCVIAFIRSGSRQEDRLLIVCNFSRNHYPDYRMGVPETGTYKVAFRGAGEGQVVDPETPIPFSYSAKPVGWHGRDNSITLALAPFDFLVLRREPDPPARAKMQRSPDEFKTTS
ncbi:1,4-alpha-glucan branching protein GlgB [Paenibacillus tarimensis]